MIIGLNDAATAATNLQGLIADAADYTVKGLFGEETASIEAGADAITFHMDVNWNYLLLFCFYSNFRFQR